MRKKLLIIVAILLFVFCAFCGCSDDADKQLISSEENRLVLISSQENDCIKIYCDRKTRVMYICSNVYCGYVFTVMLDENGKPLLYEGEL